MRSTPRHQEAENRNQAGGTAWHSGDQHLRYAVQFPYPFATRAGAFVCGEETALIASVEGKRGTPRPRPPYPAQEGLFGEPTLINNVETYANIPPIIRNGGAWYAKIGTEKSKGTKVFALAGRIANTGLVEVPMGITLREIVYDIGGGIPEGKSTRQYKPAGPPADACRKNSSTCLSTTRTYPKPAPSWGPVE